LFVEFAVAGLQQNSGKSSSQLSFSLLHLHPAHKNPVVVPVCLCFVRAPAHRVPGLNGRKTVLCLLVLTFYAFFVKLDVENVSQ